MPQLDTSTWLPQLFWLAVTFSFLYYMVSRVIIPRTGAVIEQRKSTIDGDLARAGALRTESEAALKSYDDALARARAKATEISGEARNRLNADADARVAGVNSELAAKISAAEKAVSAAKAKAMESVESIAADLSSDIVGQLIGGRPMAERK
jgi:F-type H+-transporting ATPase subunit b